MRSEYPPELHQAIELVEQGHQVPEQLQHMLTGALVIDYARKELAQERADALVVKLADISPEFRQGLHDIHAYGKWTAVAGVVAKQAQYGLSMKQAAWLWDAADRYLKRQQR